ncbi:antibiotic biosynthesis monooxygenase family protein [Lysobacter sp. FW306-1B-D06B]|uniref:antibiotic biosynthesis monooxygenase family protein n=1 Tax=unclassified Lysobacter TaxID=2635362 RepID=UPI001C21B26A|nr:antibiotic biosynthesis monooxygenase [Lysobacter sp. MMG2]
MHVIVWEYEVRPGSEAAFEAMYGADGDWVALFRTFPGYLGTELLRGDGRYLTLDRWRSEQDYTAFRAHLPSRYAELDARGDALTLTERPLGTFHADD